MSVKTVDVGDFSLTPGGRYRDEGEFSGQEFRETVLQPLIDKGFDLVIDLDKPLGFTTSFLEEVFGGLVRKYGPAIRARVKVLANARPVRAERALDFMNRAVAASA